MRALAARTDVEIVAIHPPDGAPLVRWRQAGLGRDAHRAGAEVLHSFTSAFTLTPRLPVVQTVHELPWKHGSAENAGLVHRGWILAGRRFAAATCTPSARVAEDLAPHPRLFVVPWGVGPEFRSEPDALDLRLEVELPALPPRPFALALGADRPKKRLELAARGAAILGMPVVVTGDRNDYVVNVLGQHAQVLALGRIDAQLLPALVRRAAATLVLSVSEGFALPVLESLACGTPVVATRGSVQAATAEDAAIEVDAEDPSDVARGLRRALEGDDVLRRRGLALASKRTWERTTDELVRVWRGVR